MKKLVLFALIAGATLGLYGQTQLDNSGFETWENVSAPEEEPTNWSSLKTADALAWAAPVVCAQAGSAHSGSYCVHLTNVSSWGVVANGLLTNGRVHADFDPELGYVFTEPTDAQWYQTFSDRPDSLVGWFKYAPQGSDKGKVEILLHDNTAQGILPETGSITHWVAKARYDIATTTSTWTRFSVPFNYFNGNTPDYILAVCSSGDSTVAVDGSELWLDDLELIYNPNVVSIDPPTTQNIDIGVNGTTLTVTETPNAGSIAVTGGTLTREWLWSTTSGSGYASFSPAETGMAYTPNFASPGIYYVVCETDFGTETVLSNEVTIVVTDPATNSVTITPATDQTILLNDDGTLLTANESPSPASSREWLWSTTSGSGYTSFSPAETGTTYTPNFSALGTYYIVCQSDFSGDVQISNEVVIYVPSAAGINDEDIQFSITSTQNQIEINLSYLENAGLVLYSLDGQKVWEADINNEYSQFQPGLVTGIYVYRIVTGNKIISGKIKL